MEILNKFKTLKTNWRISVLLLFSLTLTHCTSLQLSKRPQETRSSRSLADSLYSQLKRYNDDVQTLKGSLHIEMGRTRFSRSLSQVILLNKPLQLRIEGFSDFGTSLFQLLLNGSQLHLYSLEDRVNHTTQAPRAFLAKYLSLNIATKDLLIILSGGIPLEEQGHYLAVVQDQHIMLRGHASELLLDAKTLSPQSYRSKSKRGVYKVSFEQYKRLGERQFPMLIMIDLLKQRGRLRIQYDDLKLNENIPQKFFRIF
jgi:hypothetical protein